MSIRGEYIGGERVYIFEDGDRTWFLGKPGDPSPDVIVIKHNDLVRMFNRFLERIENANPELMNRYENGFLLYSLVDTFWNHDRSNFSPIINEIKKWEIEFDDPQRIKKAKNHKLRKEKKIDTRFLRPVVIRGGLSETSLKNQ